MEKDGCFTATPQLPLKERARKVLRLRDDSSRTDHLALKRDVGGEVVHGRIVAVTILAV